MTLIRRFLLILILANSPISQADITVQDSQGRDIHLAQPAQRIIALAPHVVENVFSAGAGDKLVGVVSYSDFPEQAKAIPEVGNFQSWSLESIVALQPDLVILWASGSGPDKLAALERLGIPVFVSELRKPEDISASIRAIARLAGTSAIGDAEAQRIETELARLRRHYAREKPVTVFYQIWNEPLQTINGDHMISQLLAVCGGHNVFADVPLLAPRINIESVLQKDPEAIVASGMDEARPEWLDEWRRFTSLRAVKNDRLFFIPPDYVQRPTARILLGAQQLCAQLETIPST